MPDLQSIPRPHAAALLVMGLAAMGDALHASAERGHAKPSERHRHMLVMPVQYPTIQAAIDAAAPGHLVRVLAGTYVEQLLVRKDIIVAGGNGPGTVIDQLVGMSLAEADDIQDDVMQNSQFFGMALIGDADGAFTIRGGAIRGGGGGVWLTPVATDMNVRPKGIRMMDLSGPAIQVLQGAPFKATVLRTPWSHAGRSDAGSGNAESGDAESGNAGPGNAEVPAACRWRLGRGFRRVRVPAAKRVHSNGALPHAGDNSAAAHDPCSMDHAH